MPNAATERKINPLHDYFGFHTPPGNEGVDWRFRNSPRYETHLRNMSRIDHLNPLKELGMKILDQDDQNLQKVLGERISHLLCTDTFDANLELRGLLLQMSEMALDMDFGLQAFLMKFSSADLNRMQEKIKFFGLSVDALLVMLNLVIPAVKLKE